MELSRSDPDKPAFVGPVQPDDGNPPQRQRDGHGEVQASIHLATWETEADHICGDDSGQLPADR
jgi:hypothetical protein